MTENNTLNIQVDQFSSKMGKKPSTNSKTPNKGNLMRIFKTIQEVSNEISKANTETDRNPKLFDAYLVNELNHIRNDIESLDITANLSENRFDDANLGGDFEGNMVLNFGEEYKNKTEETEGD